MQLCICTRVVCYGLVALEIHWMIVCRFIWWIYSPLLLSLYIVNDQNQLFKHKLKQLQMKLRLIQPNIINIANTLNDSWMWLNLRVNRAVTGDSSVISAWVTETHRQEQSALASVPLCAVIALLSKATNAPQSHDSEVDHLSIKKVVTVYTKIENDVRL